MEGAKNLNVAWAMTRHHNITRAADILQEESKVLDQAGLVSPSLLLLDLAGRVGMVVKALEVIKLDMPSDGETHYGD